MRRLDGRIQGGYRTPRRGSGLDFAGLRPYVDGDDARHIDWNVTARLDEPQVREFNEDRELTAWLVLDRSASMLVGGPGRGQAGRARRAGARPGPVARPERQPGRCGPVRRRTQGRRLHSHHSARHRTQPRAADRQELDRARRRRGQRPPPTLARCWTRSRTLARRSPGRRDLGLHRHGRLAASADPARPPQRGRRAADRGRCRRRDPRGRADRGRGCRDRRAAARRLRRSRGSARRFRDGVDEREAAIRAGMRQAGVPLHRVATDGDLVESLLCSVDRRDPAGSGWRLGDRRELLSAAAGRPACWSPPG